MAINKAPFAISGMTRDLAASKFSSEYAYENKNVRVEATDENTTGALVNERGNKKVDTGIFYEGISGTPIGQAVLNDELVLFTTGGTPAPIILTRFVTDIGIANRYKRYYTYNDAMNDSNGEYLDQEYSVGDYNYFFGDEDSYIGFTDTDGIRKVLSPINGGYPVLVMSVDFNFDCLYYVSSWEEDDEAPDFNGHTLSFRLYTIADLTTADNIYKINLSDTTDLGGEVLYSGNLGFTTDNPIECITVFENSDLKKVYWTDGENQPRVINIAASAAAKAKWDDNSFDFVKKLSLKEEVEVTRNLVTNGSFAPGVVQYCMTYYNLYGQQSNIFYTSPLLYVSYNDRGADAADKVGVSFSFKINQYDSKYEYLRIYCIHRTSLDATPYVRKVVDLAVPTAGYMYYTDYGNAGETIDPTELLFIGGQVASFGTMAQKDNTLFLGDIQIKKPTVSKAIKNSIRNLVPSAYATRSVGGLSRPSGLYTYNNLLQYDSSKITTFKVGETYRLGVQLQDQYGVWSSPIWVTDYEVNNGSFPILDDSGNFYKINISTSFSAIFSNALLDVGYLRIRPVIVYPSITDRTIVCQGVLCPTVYNVGDRYNNSPAVQSSWFFRPNAPVSNIYNSDLISSGGTYDATYTPVMSNSRDLYNDNVINAATVNNGKWAEFRHNKKIPGNSKENAEIQCITHPPEPFLQDVNESYTESSDPAQWVSENKECFYVDQSIVTMHSPDIEFDKEVRSIDFSNLKLRIVGYIPLTSHVSDIDISVSTPPLNYSKGSDNEYTDTTPGLYKEKVSYMFTSNGRYGWKSALSGPYWLDELYGSAVDNSEKKNVGFIVYPWHRNGSLNNTRSVESGQAKSAMLLQKKMSILRHSYYTEWFNTPWYAYETGSSTKTGISGVMVYDSNEVTNIKLPEPENSNIGEINYSGNIDKIITFHTNPKPRSNQYALDRDTDNFSGLDSTTSSFYPIIVAKSSTDLTIWEGKTNPSSVEHSFTEAENHNFRSSDSHWIFGNPYARLRRFDNNIDDYCGRDVQTCSNDPVYMRYKSTPHAVIALNYTTGRQQRILPTHNNTNMVGDTTAKCCPSYYTNALFWDPNYDNASSKIMGASQDSIDSFTPTTGYLWMGELYNDTIDSTKRFGGQTEEAFENNQWLPAGESVYISRDAGCSIVWSEGDTYYQRYDCLKTYPFTMEDQNSIVDILSFMVETRVNIDGRYDRNRGQTNNLYMSPSNFNLLNDVYSQKNNFFNYRGENENKLLLNNFPNTITWTKTKTLGEEVDTWTNITLASTLDLDGDLGSVRALRRFNDNILAFQDKGISQILYNESVQIASTTGVPIEIANSGKVSGKRYISNKIGCTNKWSICSTPNGLYFLDTLGRDLYLFNGQFNNLSDRLGFHSWISSNVNSINIWNPVSFDSCITYYDKVNGEVLFITKDTALAFSETSNQFTSFYDYGGTSYFANLEDRGIAIHKDYNNDTYYPFMHREGLYNHFYGEYKPFWTTVIVNPNATIDKIFNNLEFHADTFDSTTGVYKHDVTFDTLRVWNEYQEGVSTLANTVNRPSTLKKKFRTWRANIPRWNVDKNGHTANGRDRMRNPWLYLKLSTESQDNLDKNYKVVLHDLVVDYFE